MTIEPNSRILIIDNDEDLLRAVRLRLEEQGYECAIATSGAQGLSIFAADAIDLVITDLNMPGGDGITVVEQIREQSPVPILIMTGFSSSFQDQLREMEHVSCLRKPFDTEMLIDLVETELALAPPRANPARHAA